MKLDTRCIADKSHSAQEGATLLILFEVMTMFQRVLMILLSFLILRGIVEFFSKKLVSCLVRSFRLIKCRLTNVKWWKTKARFGFI